MEKYELVIERLAARLAEDPRIEALIKKSLVGVLRTDLARNGKEYVELTRKLETAEVMVGAYFHSEPYNDEIKESFVTMLRESSVSSLCKMFGVSKSTFYDQIRRLGLNTLD